MLEPVEYEYLVGGFAGQGAGRARTDEGARMGFTRQRRLVSGVTGAIAAVMAIAAVSCAARGSGESASVSVASASSPATPPPATPTSSRAETSTATDATPPVNSTSAALATTALPTPTTTLAVASTAQPVDDSVGADAALATLATLAVKGRAPMTDYTRDMFGAAWTDDVPGVDGGRNGCDTRNDILRRDLGQAVIDVDGCQVISGVLHDPYTGEVVDFASSSPDTVQIDHVVALADAWATGIQYKSVLDRVQFANDPLDLQATAASINTQKSDGDSATWLPPNKSYRCTYVARQISVKAKYSLWVTQAEHEAMATVLQSCGGTLATTSTQAPSSRRSTTAPPPAPASAPDLPTTSSTAPATSSTAPAPPRTTSRPPHTSTTVRTTPKPAPTTPKPPPTTAAPEPQSCHPLSNSGNCYKPGQMCRKSDHEAMGIDAYGERIQCQNVNGWRWERI